jgi:hypothetical protein
MLNRADEFAAHDNYHGQATWRRIIEAVGQLVNKTLRRLVWGFSCQAVVLGLLSVFCSERERPFFVPSPAIRFAERAEGVKGPKR